MPFFVSRPHGGITLNAGIREELTDADGNTLYFDSIKKAEEFLIANGVDADELDTFESTWRAA